MKSEDILQIESVYRQYSEGAVDLSTSNKLSPQEVKQWVNDRYQLEIKTHTLNYLVEIGVANPKSQEEFATRLFNQTDVVHVLTALHMKEHEDWSYSKILGGLLQVSIRQRKVLTTGSNNLPVPSQSQRALITLRSRLIGNLINWLYPNQEDGLNGLVILIRHRNRLNQSQKNKVKIKHAQIGRKGLIDEGDTVRPSDILGEMNGNEVLLMQRRIKRLRDSSIEYWEKLEVEGRFYQEYLILIGHPSLKDKLLRFNVTHLADQFANGVLELMLHSIRADVEPEDAIQASESSEINQGDPYLRGLLRIILNLSPHWEYAAVYVPRYKIKSLRRVAIAGQYPKELDRFQDVKMGVPLVGWAFEHDHYILINQTEGMRGNIVFRQEIEHTKSAIAMPTHARDNLNGVLYVGRCFDHADKPREVFAEEHIILLEQIASVIGEVIDRSETRKAGSEHALQNLDLRMPAPLPLDQFRSIILQDLREKLHQDHYFTDQHNLHITIFKVEWRDGFKLLDPKMAQWILEHIFRTAFLAFSKHPKLHKPKIFADAEMSKDRFVFYLPQVILSNDEDRETREAFRLLLNSNFAAQKIDDLGEPPFRVLLWSLPFRLNVLQNKYLKEKISLKNLSENLKNSAMSSMKIVSFVEKGHQFESAGNYQSALQQYELALNFSPNDIYIKRHLAKCLAACKEYSQSIEYWREIVHDEDSVIHMQRLAYTLALTGEIDGAEKLYEAAYARNPVNGDLLEDWGDCLYAAGKLDEAVAKYFLAISLANTQVEADRIEPKIALAWSEDGEVDKAKAKLRVTLERNFNNREARFLSIKLSNVGQEDPHIEKEVTH